MLKLAQAVQGIRESQLCAGQALDLISLRSVALLSDTIQTRQPSDRILTPAVNQEVTRLIRNLRERIGAPCTRTPIQEAVSTHLQEQLGVLALDDPHVMGGVYQAANSAPIPISPPPRLPSPHRARSPPPSLPSPERPPSTRAYILEDIFTPSEDSDMFFEFERYASRTLDTPPPLPSLVKLSSQFDGPRP
jgi:hypothetical protein